MMPEFAKFQQLIADHQLLVCVGPGGVGKTTVSAALGLACAQLGHRTLVLTIDPARRLADLLGLSTNRGALDEPVEVTTDTPGPMFAAMLDSGASYDRLIAKIATDEAHRQQILNNRIYQLMSRAFGQSHAYVAMERLYAALTQGEYTRIVLDTPPTRNALDILDAPGRLATFLDEEALQWFIQAPKGGLRQRLLARGGTAAARLLKWLTGGGLVDELRDFLGMFMSLRPGFRDRAEAVTAHLRAAQTAFVLVTSPQPGNLDDADYLRRGLNARDIYPRAAICNQAFVELDQTGAGNNLRELVETTLAGGSQQHVDALCRASERAAAEVERDNAAALARFDRFSAGLEGLQHAVAAPRWPRELRSIDDLQKFAARLLAD